MDWYRNFGAGILFNLQISLIVHRLPLIRKPGDSDITAYNCNQNSNHHQSLSEARHNPFEAQEPVILTSADVNPSGLSPPPLTAAGFILYPCYLKR